MESQKRFFPACYKNSRRCTHKNPSGVSDVASTNREQRSKVRGRKELLVCWCPDYPHGLSCVVTMTMLQWRSGPKMGCIPCIVSQKRTSILVRFQISICSLFRSGLCRSILSTWLDSSCALTILLFHLCALLSASILLRKSNFGHSRFQNSWICKSWQQRRPLWTRCSNSLRSISELSHSLTLTHLLFDSLWQHHRL